MLFQLEQLFHMSIVSLCENDMLIRAFDRLHAHSIIISIYAVKNKLLHRMDKAQDEHERIYQALLARDADAMQTAMIDHLRQTEINLSRLYDPKTGKFMVK